MNTFSEPNTILEINEAHADNFLLVIPKLPTAPFLSSYFQEVGHPTFPTTTSPDTTASSGCGDGPEFDPDNPVNNPSTIETGCTTGSSGDCNIPDGGREGRLRREGNLDLANFKLYISDVELPGVNLDTVRLGTQFADIARASKIKFTDLNTTMLVSENLLDYNAILYWLYALHNPEQFHQLNGRGMIQEFFTDVHLIITNNHREKVAEYKFIDAFPFSLNPQTFSYKNADKLTMNVTWAHSGMVPENNFVLRYV